MSMYLPLLQRRFPLGSFEPQWVYEAVLPVYTIGLELEVHQKQPISQFARFFMRAIALGENTSSRIAYLLGLEERDLAVAGAELLTLGYIEQGAPVDRRERKLTLTPAGDQALLGENLVLIPQKRRCTLQFNTLTRTLMSPASGLWRSEAREKEGLLILPQTGPAPTLGDLPPDGILSVLKGSRTYDDIEALYIDKITKRYLEYAPDVEVFVLLERETQQQRIAMFRDGIYYPAESEVLEGLAREGKLPPPSDARRFAQRRMLIADVLAPSLLALINQLLEMDWSLASLEAELLYMEESASDTRGERERAQADSRRRWLEEKRDEVRSTQEALRFSLESEGGVRLLEPADHRPMLEQALEEAQREVIIISPWMSTRAVDQSLCEGIARAVQRGVHVRIGYARPQSLNSGDIQRHALNVDQAKEAITRQIPAAHLNLLTITQTSGSYDNILVCDRAWAVFTFFNWLTDRGASGKSYMRDIGVLVRAPYQVEQVAQKAAALL